MKKILLSVTCFLICWVSLQAQILYGTTFYGGNDGGGTISKFTPVDNALTVSKFFEKPGINPWHTVLVQAGDGKLYGMTSAGGSEETGVIFSYDPSSSTYRQLKHFNKADGQIPNGSLLLAGDGKLYGMTPYGGSTNQGVMFSLDPSASVFTKLLDFDSAKGINPGGSMIQAKDGLFYGTTSSGGSTGNGVIFSFDPSTFTYSRLRDFDGINGAYPIGDLMQASDGKLYGMTFQGGSNDNGVIFSYDPSSFQFTKLKDLSSVDGNIPQGKLIQATDGKLYGLTYGGGSIGAGVIFSIDPATSIYTKLVDFDNTNGANPLGSLIQASDGKLYGLTYNGGNNFGVIFVFDPTSSTITKLKDFDVEGGTFPAGSLMQANNGKLYGMTSSGGKVSGVLFSFDPTTSNYNKLKDFGANESGSSPSGKLIQAKNEKLYGMMYEGGSNGVGVIFSYDAAADSYSKLFDFDKINGANPYGNLMEASDGKLYGLTFRGGANNNGVMFSYDPASSAYVKLKDFDNSTGTNPIGNLIQGTDGKLYGMTNGESAGANSNGGIFSYDIPTAVFTRLKLFNTATGGNYPFGSLLQAKDGNLYGMTLYGGSSNFGNGVIFSLNPAIPLYSKLLDFDGINGSHPVGSFLQSGDGKLYSMTPNGGSSGNGVIFSFDPASSAYTKLHDFDNNTGIQPNGDLMLSTDGKMYGTTNLGGDNNLGVIFSFDPLTSAYTKLVDFDGSNGERPTDGSAFIELKECAVKTTFYKDADGDTYGSPTDSVKACTQPAGYVANNTDCDDTRSSVHPGATEICGNGIDDNCNGQVDEGCSNEPEISINDVTVDESKGVAVLTVTLSRASSKPVWILYYTKEGTAENLGRHKDYVARIGLLVIRPGSRTATIAIKIIKDRIQEPTEYFDVVLVRSFNATIADGSGRVFITGTSYSKNAYRKTSGASPVNNLTIEAMPNPTASQFILAIESNDKRSPVELKVFDVQGKLIESKINLFAGQKRWMGGNYLPGNYIIHAIQGEQRKTISVIKLSK